MVTGEEMLTILCEPECLNGQIRVGEKTPVSTELPVSPDKIIDSFPNEKRPWPRCFAYQDALDSLLGSAQQYCSFMR